jgi:hypothetical protein
VSAPGATGASSAAGDDTGDAGELDAPDPLDDPMSPESIDQRYRLLAASVTTGTDDCRSAKARDGQRERLRCETAAGTLELVTWTRRGDLVARRAAVVTDQPGGILDASRSRTMMAFEGSDSLKGAPRAKGGKARSTAKGAADDDLRGSGRTYLYWDVERTRQSGTFVADTGTGLATLAAAYDATDPVRPYPTGLTDRRLIGFAGRWVGSGECLRTVTVNAGALEESYCDVEGPVEVFVGRFRTADDLKAYRTLVVASAIADKRGLRDWRKRPGQDPVGALYEYTTDDGTVARYWDDTACLCYAEAFLARGSYQRLARWWER